MMAQSLKIRSPECMSRSRKTGRRLCLQRCEHGSHHGESGHDLPYTSVCGLQIEQNWGSFQTRIEVVDRCSPALHGVVVEEFCFGVCSCSFASNTTTTTTTFQYMIIAFYTRSFKNQIRRLLGHTSYRQPCCMDRHAVIVIKQALQAQPNILHPQAKESNSALPKFRFNTWPVTAGHILFGSAARHMGKSMGNDRSHCRNSLAIRQSLLTLQRTNR